MDGVLAAWKRLTTQSDARTKAVQDILTRLYSNPSRRYHNLNHIKQCLIELEEFKSMHPQCLSSSDIDEISIAVWFHDAIYDPKALNNEEESIHLFEQVCEGMDVTSRDRIREMILATKHRDYLCCSFVLQAQVMLDLDLSILGKSKSEFDEYDKAIRMEYGWVPEAIFREKRAAVLRNFLQRDRIYLTDYFHQKFNTNARSNLKRVIAHLSTSSSLESQC